MDARPALLALLALFALGVPACASRDPELPYGEVLLTVDSDVDVDRFASMLRVDLFHADGTWFESSEFSVPGRSAWPVSFGLVVRAPRGGRDVLVRLRTFASGRVRDYHGERAAPPPHVESSAAASIEALCSAPPALALGTALVARRGPTALFTRPRTTSCPDDNRAGSIAARLVIERRDRYRIGVIATYPESSQSRGGFTTLSLRSACADVTTELACAGRDAGVGWQNGVIDRELDPGVYYVVTGGPEPATADVTLLADRAHAFRYPDDAPQGAPPDESPRLVVDGRDVTPRNEPNPAATIDRLVELRIEGGVRASASVTLRGDCFGRPAELRARRGCVDGDHLVSTALALSLAAFDDRPGATAAGTWPSGAARPCVGSPRKRTPPRDGIELTDEEVCVPGGALLFGHRGLAVPPLLTASPERVAVVPPFFMDRFEVTVARLLAARMAGFVPPTEPRAYSSLDPRCNWGASNRQRHPLNCVSWQTARAYCRWTGGDLPTEVQWELAARVAGRTKPTRWPWGDAWGDCQSAILGRCGSASQAVDDGPWAFIDVTPDGISGLGGNVREWVLDSARGFDHALWARAPLVAPLAWEEAPPLRSVRGGGFLTAPDDATTTSRHAATPTLEQDDIGFRCVRSDGAAP